MLRTAVRRLSRDSLARNSLLIMATTVSNGGLGYFYWMLAARSVPPNRIGTATALISAATAVSMIANLGAGHMFIQRLPGSDAVTWSRIVGTGLFVGSAATAATATAAALIVPLFSGNFGFLSGPGGTAALIAAAVAVTLTTLLDNLYVAHRSGHGMLIRNLAVAAGKIVTLLAVLAAGAHGATAVLVSYILPTLLISLATIAVGPRRLRPSPHRADAPAATVDRPGTGAIHAAVDRADSSAAHAGVDRAGSSAAHAGVERAGSVGSRPGAGRFGESGPRPGGRTRWRTATAGLRAELPHLRTAVTGHHLINLTQAGPAALLPVLVTARLGPDANAHFYLAWMTASMLFMVSPAVASALYAERTNAAAVPVSRAAVVVLAMVGAPAAVLLIAGDRILALFSAGYAAEGGLLLQILVLAALPDAVANLAVAHWRSHGRFRLCRRLNLVRAITCLILAWLLLPGSGVTGAGVAWLTGQTAAALLVGAITLTRRPRPPAVAATDPDGPDSGVGAGGEDRPGGPGSGVGGDSRRPGGERRDSVGVPQEVGKRRQAGRETPTGRKR
ncbi:lipopolysaccharide biosynthesis protein [Actinoplanes xinjiangensis]|uniref:lipopolysaccharide biosynthesis protein n=1 Tax=Actinoplanes xinjiangensis TaxID=512350 RepID=UPI00343199CE